MLDGALCPLPCIWIEFKPFCIGMFWLTGYVWFGAIGSKHNRNGGAA